MKLAEKQKEQIKTEYHNWFESTKKFLVMNWMRSLQISVKKDYLN